MRRFLLDYLTGVLLSVLVQVVGGWYFHYLPWVAVVHAFTIGFLYGVFRSGLRRFVLGRRFAFWGTSLFFVAYFYVWLIMFSSLLAWSSLQRYTVSLVLVLILFGVAEFVRKGLERMLGGRRKVLSCAVITVLILGMIVMKGFAVGLVPISVVDRLALRINPITSGQGFFRTIRRIAYPYSLPMEKGIRRFDWLVAREDSAESRHTIILILDTLREDSVGSQVGEVPVTPTIDRVRKNALQFNNYYVQATWTKPSTASLFTGLYLRDHSTFLGWNPDPSRVSEPRFYGQELPNRFRTLAERLNEEGVRTFGSVSISHISSNYQFDQGFETWFDPLATSNERDDYAGVQRQLFWLLRQDSPRSFSYLHMTGPHYPYAVSSYNRQYWKQTKFFTAAGLRLPGKGLPMPRVMSPQTLPARRDLSSTQIQFVRHLYHSKLNLYDRKIVKPFLQGLRSSGVFDSTNLIITADHGEELFDYRRFGHVRNLRESVVSPPLIVRRPQDGYQSTSERMVESLDLSATILDWNEADTAGISGSSFANRPIFTRQKGVALSEIGISLKLEQSVNRKRIRFEPNELGVNVAMIRQAPWKLYHHYRNSQDVLINIPKDPAEAKAIGNRPRVTEKLREKIFSTLGSDSSLRTPPGPLLKADEQELKNLEGLGYL